MHRWSRTDTAVAAEAGVKSMSRGRVSRLCASLDAEVAEMRPADLSAEPWPHLWLNAAYVPGREAGSARSCALATAVAYLDFPHEHAKWVHTVSSSKNAAHTSRDAQRRDVHEQSYPPRRTVVRRLISPGMRSSAEHIKSLSPKFPAPYQLASRILFPGTPLRLRSKL